MRRGLKRYYQSSHKSLQKSTSQKQRKFKNTSSKNLTDKKFGSSIELSHTRYKDHSLGAQRTPRKSLGRSTFWINRSSHNQKTITRFNSTYESTGIITKFDTNKARTKNKFKKTYPSLRTNTAKRDYLNLSDKMYQTSSILRKSHNPSRLKKNKKKRLGELTDPFVTPFHSRRGSRAASDYPVQVKSLDKWKTLMHEKVTGTGRHIGGAQKGSSQISKTPQAGMSGGQSSGFRKIIPSFHKKDSGGKMINLMGLVLKVEDGESNTKKIHENPHGFFSLSAPRSLPSLSSNEHNKKILESVIKKKLDFKNIQFIPSRRADIEQEAIQIRRELSEKFFSLKILAEKKTEIKKECKYLVKSILDDTTSNGVMKKIRKALNQENIDRCKKEFFEKFGRIDAEIKFCEKKIREKEDEIDELHLRAKELHRRCHEHKKTGVTQLKHLQRMLEAVKQDKMNFAMRGSRGVAQKQEVKKEKKKRNQKKDGKGKTESEKKKQNGKDLEGEKKGGAAPAQRVPPSSRTSSLNYLEGIHKKIKVKILKFKFFSTKIFFRFFDFFS